MPRGLAVLSLSLLLAGCPGYDRYARVVDEKGYVPADVFARYGAEQAQAVAIGRALGMGRTGASAADLERQVAAAADYARKLPDVVDVQADAQAYLLTVTFRSGWRKAVTPIDDGVAADQTPGLPAR